VLASVVFGAVLGERAQGQLRQALAVREPHAEPTSDCRAVADRVTVEVAVDDGRSTPRVGEC
jgi:hypothetical protein